MIERYDVEDISSLFTTKRRYETFLQVELANCRALCKLGVIPSGDLAKIERKAKVDLARIEELEKAYRHDVIAFDRSVDEKLGEEKRWFHFGLTSSDVVDTAMSLLYRKATDVLLLDGEKLLDVYRRKALKYRDLPSIGRTHGMHAEITSFGLRFARFYAELKRDLRRLGEAAEDLCRVKMSGAVGNYALASYEAEKLVSEELGLPACDISTQVIPRDNHAFYFNALALIASHVENASVEFRNLSRPEIQEVAERFEKRQKGSSAMPHKHNPIGLENMCGIARLVRGYSVESYENIPLYHERDISHSSYERIAFPDAIGLTDYLLRRMASTVESLVVFEANVVENIGLSKGVVFSERVLSEAVKKGLSREEAYDEIQRLAFEVMEPTSSQDFKQAISRSPLLSPLFTFAELDDLFEAKFFLRRVKDIYRKVGIL